MKFYNLDTDFTLGKFEGKTVKDILNLDPNYLEWCAVHLDQFCMTEEVIGQIRAIMPGFALSEEAKQSLKDKFDNWQNVLKREQMDHDDESYEQATYENYNGSYAQDIEGWSDQDIDDVFDGDPDAYWNID
jgi:hypothetical protein